VRGDVVHGKMNQDEYTDQVRKILDEHTESARENLRKLPSCLPSEVSAIELTIFVDQDGEGFLTVRVSVEGPDLYVINKSIEGCAVLFDTIMKDGGLVPPLPLMDPFEEDFSVHDALSDCAADWLVNVWNGLNGEVAGVPVSIISHDEYGTKTPISLYGGSA
jgi:hypothetical protein